MPVYLKLDVSRMSKIGAFFRLTRVEHNLLLIVAVLVGELIAGGLPVLPVLILSLAAPVFISMSSFAINDYFDVESDRANKRRDRPIVSGEISKNGALGISVACMIIGIGAALFINVYALAIALIFGALAILYSYRLKDVLLLGNVYIAFTYGIAFVFGNLVVTKVLLPGIIAIFFMTFLAGLAREIHGMIRDYRGDVRGRRTRNLVHYTGKKRSAQIAFILYLESVLITIFMFFFIQPFRFNAYFALPVAVGDILAIYVAVVCVLRSDTGTFNFTRNLTLLGMGITTVGYLLAPLLFLAV